MPPRGTFNFEATGAGDLASSRANVEALRRLWLDRTLISGSNLGPGDEGDFDNGAWHVACHLVAAGGVRRAADGRVVWLEVSHDAARDDSAGFLNFLARKPNEANQPRREAGGKHDLGREKVLVHPRAG